MLARIDAPQILFLAAASLFIVAIITTWRTASYKPTKLGWLNSLSEQGSSVNRQRKKQACQRQVTLSSS
jgi:hypothetical protein